MSMKQTMCEFVYGMTCEEVCKFVGSIVRCRDCKHWQQFMKGAEPDCWASGEPFKTEPDDFCAWGERREP